MDRTAIATAALAEFMGFLNKYGDPSLGIQPGDLFTDTPAGRVYPEHRFRTPRPYMFVTRRGNVRASEGRLVWHTWGLGSIRERKIMAEAFIAAAGRAPVMQVPATASTTAPC